MDYLWGHRPRRVEQPARRVLQDHSIRLRTVAIFCVTLRRAVFEEVGELCEEYSRGFFEDDDYCRRAEGAALDAAPSAGTRAPGRARNPATWAGERP